MTLASKPDTACNAVMGAAFSIGGGQMFLQHPTSHATCCAHCKGEVQDIWYKYNFVNHIEAFNISSAKGGILFQSKRNFLWVIIVVIVNLGKYLKQYSHDSIWGNQV